MKNKVTIISQTRVQDYLKALATQAMTQHFRLGGHDVVQMITVSGPKEDEKLGHWKPMRVAEFHARFPNLVADLATHKEIRIRCGRLYGAIKQKDSVLFLEGPNKARDMTDEKLVYHN